VRLWDMPSGLSASVRGEGVKSEGGASGKAQVRPETLCLNTRGNMAMMRVRFSRTNLLLAAGPHNPQITT